MPTLESFGSYGYWIVFLISFFESLVFVGSFIPGSPIIIFYGFLASTGYLSFVDLIIITSLGAILGDGASFFLGKKGQKFFHEKNFLLNTKYLESSQRFFAKHGNKSIFWARFVGVIKPVIPFVAGLSAMKTRRFVFWNVASGIVWSVVHVGIGFYFGSALKAIEVWTTRLGLTVFVFSLFFIFLWFAIKKGEKAWEYTTGFVHSTGWTFVNSFPVRWFYHKFPRLYVFIQNRLKKDRFVGLPLTLISVAILIVLLSFFDLIKDVLISNAVVAMDTKIENLLVIFRDSFLVKVFLWITAFGEAQVIVSMVLVSTALFWLWRRRFYIMSLWVSVLGSAASAYVVKNLVNRIRPGGDIPVYTEHYFSFPSGHSALTMTLLGFLVYCIWRNFSTWKIRVNSFFLAGAIILLVGFSRLYLGVHFLSDVLGGYLLGFFWVLVGISISEWLIIRSIRRGGETLVAEIRDEIIVKNQKPWLKVVTVFIIIAEVFFASSFMANFRPIFNVVSQTTERQIVVRDISDPLFEKYIPKFPEDLTGDYRAPLNFLVVASDDDSFLQAVNQAGWLSADPVNAVTFAKMINSYWRGTAYPEAPLTPLFWHGKANDYAFEKTVEGEYGARYQARFWKTNIATEDGGYVYVGVAGFDTGVEYGLFRKLSDDLDISRDQLFKDLLAIKAVSSYERKIFVDNTKGKFFESGKYQTDGKAYVLYLQ